MVAAGNFCIRVRGTRRIGAPSSQLSCCKRARHRGAPYFLLRHGVANAKVIAADGSGKMIAAIGMTEPGAGSDLQAIKTRAVRDGEDYVIKGSKTFISNRYLADLICLASKSVWQQKPIQVRSLAGSRSSSSKRKVCRACFVINDCVRRGRTVPLQRGEAVLAYVARSALRRL